MRCCSHQPTDLLCVEYEDVHDEGEGDNNAGKGKVVAHLVVADAVQLGHLGLCAEDHNQGNDPWHDEHAQYLQFRIAIVNAVVVVGCYCIGIDFVLCQRNAISRDEVYYVHYMVCVSMQCNNPHKIFEALVVLQLKYCRYRGTHLIFYIHQSMALRGTRFVAILY